MIFNPSFISRLLALLALLPLGLIAYAGFFSRMKIDDFCVVAAAQQYDAWGTMLYHVNAWSGSYTRFFLIGALGPLDHMATAAAPFLIVISWLGGLTWLLYEGLVCLGIARQRRRATAVALSAIAIAATIYAFPSPRAIYWYVANTAYALPFAPLSAFMALAIRTSRRASRQASPQENASRKALLAGATICFLSAGLAEAFVTLQLCLLSCCLLLAAVSLRGAARAGMLRMLGAGWAASLGSLVLQLLSPGVMKRSMAVAQDTRLPPVRSLPALLTGTVENTFAFLSDPEMTVGFLLMMAIGALYMLTRRALPGQQPPKLDARSAQLYRPLLWLGLLIQLLCLPLLWSYVSADPQVLGRFSARYALFILFNLLAIAAYALLLWRKDAVSAILLRAGPRLRLACAVSLVIVSTLLALEITAVRIYVWFYLLSSLALFLAAFIWQPAGGVPFWSLQRASAALLICLSAAWICSASVAATVLFARGEVFIRTMTAGPYLMMLSGLAWGAILGYGTNEMLRGSRSKRAWKTATQLGLAALILVLLAAMLRDQVELIALYRGHAQQWEANHARILAMRAEGQSPITVAAMPSSFGNYMSERDAICYYGLPVTVRAAD